MALLGKIFYINISLFNLLGKEFDKLNWLDKFVRLENKVSSLTLT